MRLHSHGVLASCSLLLLMFLLLCMRIIVECCDPLFVVPQVKPDQPQMSTLNFRTSSLSFHNLSSQLHLLPFRCVSRQLLLRRIASACQYFHFVFIHQFVLPGIANLDVNSWRISQTPNAELPHPPAATGRAERCAWAIGRTSKRSLADLLQLRYV